jgi:uncharacterized protein YbjT (DUF2867 family)
LRILLTGANGFLGRYLLAHLTATGHEVVPAVRNPASTDRLLARPSSLFADFNRDTVASTWLPRLEGIDAVINCAGILQARPGQSIDAIHTDAPKALFDACKLANVRRIIQISAISAETAARTAYASTKKSADDYLTTTELDWIILRPSIVYAEGAYGGAALFRALGALPFAIPIPGDGNQTFSPIHVDDLAHAILRILASPSINRIVIDPVGPDRLVLGEMLADLRRWLGYRPVPFMHIPLSLVRIAAKFGDVFGGSMNSTSIRQLEFGNAGELEPFVRATGVQPRRWRDALLARPAQQQDRWHARLFFVRPLLRLTVALTWIASGIAGLVHTPIDAMAQLIHDGIPPQAFAIACLVDIVVGMGVLLRWQTSALAIIQLALIGFYSAVLSVAQPSLWLEPLGPLLKNLPFVAGVLALAAIEQDR